MKQTDNLKMNLPEESDVVDIEQLNDNFRMLDTELSKLMTGGCVATNIKIIDIGSDSFDPSGIDFTQYSPGDIILVVGNMNM